MTTTDQALQVDAVGGAGLDIGVKHAGASVQARTRRVPELPGILSAHEVLATAESIASVQRPDGMIPWFEGGHCDPWNHVESAMALSVAGLYEEAARGYLWLAKTQLPEGGWFNYYLADSGVKDPRLDTNVCAYVATGAWHHYVSTEDLGFLEELWPIVDRALAFVLRWQLADGTVRWSVDPDGRHGGQHVALDRLDPDFPFLPRHLPAAGGFGNGYRPGGACLGAGLAVDRWSVFVGAGGSGLRMEAYVVAAAEVPFATTALG